MNKNEMNKMVAKIMLEVEAKDINLEELINKLSELNEFKKIIEKGEEK